MSLSLEKTPFIAIEVTWKWDIESSVLKLNQVECLECLASFLGVVIVFYFKISKVAIEGKWELSFLQYTVLAIVSSILNSLSSNGAGQSREVPGFP